MPTEQSAFGLARVFGIPAGSTFPLFTTFGPLPVGTYVDAVVVALQDASVSVSLNVSVATFAQAYTLNTDASFALGKQWIKGGVVSGIPSLLYRAPNGAALVPCAFPVGILASDFDKYVAVRIGNGTGTTLGSVSLQMSSRVADPLASALVPDPGSQFFGGEKATRSRWGTGWRGMRRQRRSY